MFDFRRALASVLETHPDDDLRPLLTPWGESLDPENVLQEYPRPQMQRDSYLNLNGWWDYAFRMTNDGLYTVPESIGSMPSEFEGKILVPFSPESILSGVGHQLLPKETLWYKRNITTHFHKEKRLLLHFEAVDFACSCFVNGSLVGMHHGAYVPFVFDITDAIANSEHEHDGLVAFEVVLAVKDPSEFGCQPRGKQRLERGSIWCTAQSGIWQTVWLEEVPEIYIEQIYVHADLDEGRLELRTHVKNESLCDVDARIELRLLSSDETTFDEKSGLKVAVGSTELTCSLESKDSKTIAIHLPVENIHAWSPDDPYLYDVEIALSSGFIDSKDHDHVKSYCAFRSISTVPADSLVVSSGGIQGNKKIICLNNEPFFIQGILDQGYWPDGLLTAPCEDALEYDIKLAKRFGFNLMRKHIKTENARWYYLCDKLGMLVWQDMVNGGAHSYSAFYTSQLPTVFPRIADHLDDTHNQERFGIESEQAKEFWIDNTVEMVEYLREFPCIVGWTVFNESWGQFDAVEMTELMKCLDDTRLFDQTSGWCDQGGGDLISEHNYFRDIKVPKARYVGDRRAPFISEFGGYAYYMKQHCCALREYGYALMDTLDDFNREITRILNEAKILRPKGLAGFVYTQLSDVEDEVNGLVTYDRRVVKYTPDQPLE